MAKIYEMVKCSCKCNGARYLCGVRWNEKLEYLVEKFNVDKRFLARIMGVHERKVYRWINAENEPSITEGMRLASLFDITLNDLFYEGPPPNAMRFVLPADVADLVADAEEASSGFGGSAEESGRARSTGETG